MGSGASSANLAIQEYESRQGQKLQEDEKNAIRQFSTEGKSNEILRSEFERLKLDNSISPKLRHFIEYQIEKLLQILQIMRYKRRQIFTKETSA